MVRQAPFGHDRTAARDNAGDALGGHRHIAQQHAGVDGEVVHALLGLLDKRVAVDLPGQVLGDAIDLFQRLVDRHGADRHRRVAQNPLAGLVDVLAGGQVHHRVAAPAGGPGHLGHFFLDRGGHRRVADVGVDLGEEVTADDHRLDFRVIHVGGNHRAATGHLVTDEFRGDLGGNRGAETLPGMLIGGQARVAVLTQLLIFPDGDVFHLRGDDALAGIVHLRQVAAGLGAARRANMREAQPLGGQVPGAPAAVFAGQAVQLLAVAALLDPGGAHRLQALADINLRIRVGIGTGGIVNRQGRVILELAAGQGRRMLTDFTHRDADVLPAAGHINFS